MKRSPGRKPSAQCSWAPCLSITGQNDFPHDSSLRNKAVHLMSLLWHMQRMQEYGCLIGTRDKSQSEFFSFVFLELCRCLHLPYGQATKEEKNPASYAIDLQVLELEYTEGTSLGIIQVICLLISPFIWKGHCTPKKSVVRLTWVLSVILCLMVFYSWECLQKIPTLH